MSICRGAKVYRFKVLTLESFIDKQMALVPSKTIMAAKLSVIAEPLLRFCLVFFASVTGVYAFKHVNVKCHTRHASVVSVSGSPCQNK